MFCFQNCIVLFMVFVTTQQQVLLPQGKLHPNNDETEQKEKNKTNLTPGNYDPKPIPVVNLPGSKTLKGSIELNNGTLPDKISRNEAKKKVNATSKPTSALNHDLQEINQTLEEKTEVESGALTRGAFVFVSLGFLFILYVGIKTYRGKSQDKKRTIVKKYGIRARRTDVEMEPLPLSDDDEDETVFDLTTSREINS